MVSPQSTSVSINLTFFSFYKFILGGFGFFTNVGAKVGHVFATQMRRLLLHVHVQTQWTPGTFDFQSSFACSSWLFLTKILTPKSQQCTWGPLWNKKCLQQHLNFFWWISTTLRQKLNKILCNAYNLDVLWKECAKVARFWGNKLTTSEITIFRQQSCFQQVVKIYLVLRILKPFYFPLWPVAKFG